MNTPIKPRMDFAEPQDETASTLLRQQQAFHPQHAQFVAAEPDPGTDEDHAGEQGISAILRPKRSLWRKLLISGIALFGATVVAQSVQWIHHAWLDQSWIALGGGVAAGLVVAAGAGSLIMEWRQLYRLRKRAGERDVARELLRSQRMGKGRVFCEKLAQQAGLDRGNLPLQRWYSALHDTHNDHEVVTLYARLVQPQLDREARREISRSAAESALMIAVSPLASVDMAFIAWRNLRLVNRIARLYGIPLGYFSRLRLFKLVLLNIAFAGATELVREVGIDWMSQDVAARLSARAAQGIGVGLLTARLGVKAMELCRPLPWLDDDQPRLGDFRRELVSLLKESVQRRSESVK